MDAIDRAIQKGWHIAKNNMLCSKTWEAFESHALGRKVVLFGLGAGADFYYFKYGANACVEFIIDNDNSLHGIEAQTVISEKIDEKHKDIKVSDISVLESYEKSDVVILISSLKYYAEIAQQLDLLGFENVFALLPMEANERKEKHIVESTDRFGIYRECACKQPICDNKIVFISMFDFAGHGKEIAKQILHQNKSVDIVWLVDDLRTEVPQGIRLVSKRNKRQCYLEMETAKVWICDTGISNDYIKRQGQFYVQIKHWASITLKNFGFDLARARQDKVQLEFCKYDSSIMDYIIVGSRFDEETCRSGFDFEGKFFYAGSPRTDILFDAQDISEKIREKYGLNNQAKILLYAPTFRCKKTEEYRPELVRADLNFDDIKSALESRFGGQWFIFLRLHPVVARQSENIEKPSFVIDVSDYNDSEELVAASDIMITDYSSIMFEPAFVGKPVFLFATDRKDYIDEERQLLIDYDSLPFSIAESNEELISNIKHFEQEEYKETVSSFLNKYGVHEDGHASVRAAGFVLELLQK